MSAANSQYQSSSRLGVVCGSEMADENVGLGFASRNPIRFGAGPACGRALLRSEESACVSFMSQPYLARRSHRGATSLSKAAAALAKAIQSDSFPYDTGGRPIFLLSTL